MLDSQAGQIRAQAVQESERLARDKNASLQLLQKVGRPGGLGVRLGAGRWQTGAEGPAGPALWSPPPRGDPAAGACRRRRDWPRWRGGTARSQEADPSRRPHPPSKR